MTSLAFDIREASDQTDHRGRRRTVSVLDVLRQPVLDVLNLDTTPATTCENGPLAANSRASGPFLLCPVMCHLVALWTAVSRCPRTYSGRRPAARTVGVHLIMALDACTHSLVAFRLTMVSDSSVDVAMLLRDMMMPLPMREDWGEELERPARKSRPR